MAVPKRRQSKTRRDKRRTHDKAIIPALGVCSNCQSTIKLHTVCDECGYYRGKPAVDKTIIV